MSHYENSNIVTEPTPETVKSYLNAAAEHFAPELTLLHDERFHGFDEKAEHEGWFLKDRVVMSALVCRKIAQLLRFSEDETRVLVQAAIVGMPMRRVQYERYPVASVTAEARDTVDSEGAAILREKGVEPDVLAVAEAGTVHFQNAFGGGFITPKNKNESTLLKLQKILLFVHDSVHQVRGTSRSGTAVWHTVIGDWREWLAGAEERYAAIAAERFPVAAVNGVAQPDTGHFALERKALAVVEKDLMEAFSTGMSARNYDTTMPPWKFIQQELFRDIQEARLPHGADAQRAP